MKNHTLEVGQILMCSWGYDQTNIDFYQVLKVTDSGVYIRQTLTEEVETNQHKAGHSMMGTCVPARDKSFLHTVQYHFKSDAPLMFKRVNPYNRVRIASYATAGLWDGAAKHWSADH